MPEKNPPGWDIVFRGAGSMSNEDAVSKRIDQKPIMLQAKLPEKVTLDLFLYPEIASPDEVSNLLTQIGGKIKSSAVQRRIHKHSGKPWFNYHAELDFLDNQSLFKEIRTPLADGTILEIFWAMNNPENDPAGGVPVEISLVPKSSTTT